MKNYLAIDSSGPILSVALQCGDSPIQEKTHAGNWGHMEQLFPFIDELLRSQNLKMEALDCFLINRGPGSFTGLRIGFSVLQGFMAADPKPCFGCDSLTALAERIPEEKQSTLAVCMDAYRAKFYVKIFSNQKGTWLAQEDSQALTMQAAVQKIPAGAIITGDSLDRHRGVFEQAAEKKFVFAPKELWYPRAASLIRLYKNHPENLKKLISSTDFLPVYLRLSEPEERKLEMR